MGDSKFERKLGKCRLETSALDFSGAVEIRFSIVKARLGALFNTAYLIVSGVGVSIELFSGSFKLAKSVILLIHDV